MEIYTVRPGDTMYSLALEHRVPMAQLIATNQLPDPSRLVVGQSLLIRRPKQTHIVRPGETLWSIAQAHGLTVRELLRRDPQLRGQDRIWAGQSLVLTYEQQPTAALTTSSYAYPSIQTELLTSTLPYLSRLSPFSYRPSPQGDLLPFQDTALVERAIALGTAPVLHLSNLDDQERFSPQLAHDILHDRAVQDHLTAQLLDMARSKGYLGVEVDFEYVYGQDAALYAGLLSRLRQALSASGMTLTVDLAPKTSDSQPGRLYEGHDYPLIAQSVDYALLMTYDWGWSGGPPMAIAPLPQVRQVVDYALTHFHPSQLILGIPTYGYDWTLPFREGARAVSLGHVQAVELAWDRHAAIRYDTTAQAPWFRYYDRQGQEHAVWFEDVRSIHAKLELALEKKLRGVGFWNLDRPFPQCWQLLDATAQIRQEIPLGMDFSSGV